VVLIYERISSKPPEVLSNKRKRTRVQAWANRDSSSWNDCCSGPSHHQGWWLAANFL
jgi:hypothetical protein